MVAGGGSAIALSAVESGGKAGSPALAGISGVAGGASTALAASGQPGSTSSSSVRSTKPSSPLGPAAVQGVSSDGLLTPAGGAPLSTGIDPAAPSTAGRTAARGPAVTLPTPSAGALPTVAAMSHDVTPDAVVLLSAALTQPQLVTLSKLKGVSRIETVDTGTVTLGGAPVVAFGVDPNTFRNMTPAASASSDQLWQYLAGGSLVSSYDMAGDRKLKLGQTETITPASPAPDSSVKGWLGAFASIGLPGVDLLVDHQYSSQLGLTSASGLVVSAPALAGMALQSELQGALPGGAVELLHADQLPTNLPGNTLGAATRQKILSAALSRVGLPYVWGAAGPSTFDCSGLVQWSFRQAGILMPRVAAEQFLTGDHIPLADAQAGDLLFWANDPSDPGYVDHVGIYLGNGTLVEAPHTGAYVQVITVPPNNFAGAVEVVLAG